MNHVNLNEENIMKISNKLTESLIKAIEETSDEKMTEIQKDTLLLAFIKGRNYTLLHPLYNNFNQ
tara:strand:- start:9 stop:203 length:195 start_codon:yes stop_codon:yes gene_type:complete